MSFMSELLRIVNGALRLDIDKVRNYTAFLAEKLEKAGDRSSAARLRKMLEESDHQLRPAGAAFAKALPVDEESRYPLIEQVNLKTLSGAPVFLDEFDALAKLRGDSQELGELKRVVNSFIQNLDTLGSHSIVIAATNHLELLDSAIWRRFGYRLARAFPAADLREKMSKEFNVRLEFTDREIALLVDLSDGFSGSDIREVYVRLRRRQLTKQQHPRLKDAFQVLQNVRIGEGEDRRFLSHLRAKEVQTIATLLRDRNAKLYSFGIWGSATQIAASRKARQTRKNALAKRNSVAPVPRLELRCNFRHALVALV